MKCSILFEKEMKVNSNNICEILEKYFEYSKEHEKQSAKDFDSKYDDYRDINEKKN